jgi:hypothetical protein
MPFPPLGICEVLITQRPRFSGGFTVRRGSGKKHYGRCQSTEFFEDLISDWKPFTVKDRPSKSKG